MHSEEERLFFSTEDIEMRTPDWLRPALYGGACGAIAVAAIGFSPLGGWMTGGKARAMAADQSRSDVIAALSVICVDQSKRDPQLAEKVAALKEASPWARGEAVIKNGWATMPGSTEGSLDVARACADKVAA